MLLLDSTKLGLATCPAIYTFPSRLRKSSLLARGSVSSRWLHHQELSATAGISNWWALKGLGLDHPKQVSTQEYQLDLMGHKKAKKECTPTVRSPFSFNRFAIFYSEHKRSGYKPLPPLAKCVSPTTPNSLLFLFFFKIYFLVNVLMSPNLFDHKKTYKKN